MVIGRSGGFLRSVRLTAESIDAGRYPFDVPAVLALAAGIEIGPVTVFVGENGSGKSTIVEALAVAAGFNPEGGSRNLQFETMSTHSELSEHSDSIITV